MVRLGLGSLCAILVFRGKRSKTGAGPMLYKKANLMAISWAEKPQPETVLDFLSVNVN